MEAWKGWGGALLLLVCVLASDPAWGLEVVERTSEVLVERDGREMGGSGKLSLRGGDRVQVRDGGHAVLSGARDQSIVLVEGSLVIVSSGRSGGQAFRMGGGLARVSSSTPVQVTAPNLRLWCTRADLLVHVVRDVTAVYVLSGTARVENVAGAEQVLVAGTRLIATETMFRSRPYDLVLLEGVLGRMGSPGEPFARAAVMDSGTNGDPVSGLQGPASPGGPGSGSASQPGSREGNDPDSSDVGSTDKGAAEGSTGTGSSGNGGKGGESGNSGGGSSGSGGKGGESGNSGGGNSGSGGKGGDSGNSGNSGGGNSGSGGKGGDSGNSGNSGGGKGGGGKGGK
jgi:hypothetical protein